MNFFEVLRNIFWRKYLKEVNIDRSSPRIIPLKDAKHIGVFYTYKNEQHRKEVDAFLKEIAVMGANVHVLVYYHGKEIPAVLTNSGYTVYCRRSVPLNKVPVDADVDKFLAKQYDIFIDLSTIDNYQNTTIAFLVKAVFKVGRNTVMNHDIFDFSFEVPEDITFSDYSQHILHYLSTIKNN